MATAAIAWPATSRCAFAPTTGIPYWYFHGLPGQNASPNAGHQIDRLDPGGEQWRRLGPERALGCVYWVATEVIEPGVVHHDGQLLRFPIGEPDGGASPRIERLNEAMAAARLNPQIVPDIRAWIWAKMISSLCWNPVAALTGATLAEMNAQPAVVAIVRRMMAEADALAARVGVPRLPLSIDERINAARNAGAHKMSMLQDLERGRPLEIDVLMDSVLAMRDLTPSLLPSTTPTIDDLYALLRLRAAGLRGCGAESLAASKPADLSRMSASPSTDNFPENPGDADISNGEHDRPNVGNSEPVDDRVDGPCPEEDGRPHGGHRIRLARKMGETTKAAKPPRTSTAFISARFVRLPHKGNGRGSGST